MMPHDSQTVAVGLRADARYEHEPAHGKEHEMRSQELLKEANFLITRAHRLMDKGRVDEAFCLLDRAEEMTDEAERLETVGS